MSVKVENLNEEKLSPKQIKKNNKKNKRWKNFTKLMLSVQGLTTIIFLIMLFALAMLPTDYFICVVILLLMFWLISLVLMGSKPKKKDKNKSAGKKRRTFGTVFAALVSVVCLFGSFAIGKLIGTMDTVSGHTTTEDTIGVYVLTADPAQSISDAKDYSFGVTGILPDGSDDTSTTIKAINSEVSQEIVTVNKDNVYEVIGALYSGEVGAVILDEAFEAVITDMDEYENFSEDTRIIYEKKIEKNITDDNSVGDITKDPFVVYISGSDTRSTTLAKSRSDVNILAIVNPSTKQVLLLNTPRDYYIEPSVYPGEKDKLTHCGLYGIECSMDTLGALYGIEVNYYSQINFTGLETLVDAVGGITVESDRDFKSSSKASLDGTKYSFVKGENQLNGAQALAFARERKNLKKDGDIGRGIHQMAVIKGIINKMTSPAIITGYADIMDSLEGMCATDVASDDMSALVKMQLDDGSSWNIKSYTVTGTADKLYCKADSSKPLSVIVPDQNSIDLAKTLVNKVISGGELTDADLEGSAGTAE